MATKPNKCPARREQVIDSGPFTTKAAKTGAGVVRQAFAPPGTAAEAISFTPSKETKKSVCPKLKGGGDAKCRVQLTSSIDFTSLALRLCSLSEKPGFVIPVDNALEARQKAAAFCACKASKGAEACALHLGAQAEVSKRKTRELRGDDSSEPEGDVDVSFDTEEFEQAAGSIQASIARMRDPAKRAMATAWLNYTTGATSTRPHVTDDMERDFARKGFVDPVYGYSFDAYGRSLEKRIGPKGKGKSKLSVVDRAAFFDRIYGGRLESVDGIERYRFTVSVGKKRDGSIDYVTAGAFWLDAPADQDDRVGSVNFSYMEDGTLVADDVWVLEKHQRQGIAKRMYEEVEQQTGLEIRPSDLQTQQGASFWQGGRGR